MRLMVLTKQCLILCILLFSCIPDANPQNVGSVANDISTDSLMSIVSTLASPEYDGRRPASTGYRKAADFASVRFRQMGLKPLGNMGYFQEVPVEYTDIYQAPQFSIIGGNGPATEYILGKDFSSRGNTGSGTVTAGVVFCGYGISEPHSGYDDYEKMDVKDKVVLILKQNPSWASEKFKGVDMGTRYKAVTAAKRGAKAILFVTQPNMENPQAPIGSLMDGEGTYDINIPQLQISLQIAAQLLEGTGKTLSWLQTEIDSSLQPSGLLLNSIVNVSVGATYQKDKISWNVIGMLPGSDPVLKDEYIILSAHLDHVGRYSPDVYYPGANDDASGSAAVIEMARVFSLNKSLIKRSVVFVLFTSEEQGLYGARFMVENPVVPLEKIVALLNLDCVGVGDSIQVGSGKSSPNLWKMAWEADSLASHLMTKDTWYGGGADATPFFEKQVPTLYFVSRNSYPHLHLPTDTPETFNKTMYTALVKIACNVAARLVSGEYGREPIAPAK